MLGREYLSLTLCFMACSFSLHSEEEVWKEGHSTLGEPPIQKTVAELSAVSSLIHTTKPPKKHFTSQLKKQQNPEAREAAASSIRDSLFSCSSFSSSSSSSRSFKDKKPKKLNFTAITSSDVPTDPRPDTQGAAGPTQFLVCINDHIRSFSKKHGLPDGGIDISTDAFFSAFLGPNEHVTDPQLRYDFHSKAWFLMMDTFDPSFQNNQILIAVTQDQTITPSTVWNFFSFRPDLVSPPRPTTDFADFPTLGIDRVALYIGVNVFNFSMGDFTTDLFVVRKKELLENQSPKITVFRDLINLVTHVGPFTPQGVDNFDDDSKDGFAIGTNAAKNSSLILLRVKDPGGNPKLAPQEEITVTSTLGPLLVPSRGALENLETVGEILTHAHIRDNLLYTAQEIGVNNHGVSSSTPGQTPSRNGCRWYEIDVSKPKHPKVRQSGTLFKETKTNTLNAEFFWVPAVMTNKDHKMVLGCSSSGAKRFANAVYAIREACDPLGTLRKPHLYTHSTTPFNFPFSSGLGYQRWGGYSSVSLDPEDSTTMWCIQEWCNATNSWGCQVIRLP